MHNSGRNGMRPNDATSTIMFPSNSIGQNVVDPEAEMRRVNLELQKATEMYNKACREALLAKQRVVNSLIRKGVCGKGFVGVAIDKDNKISNKYALEWAVDNVVSKGQSIILIHVMDKSSSSSSYGPSCMNGDLNDKGVKSAHKEQLDMETRQLFLKFKLYCTRKNIRCLDVVLDGTDVAKTLNEYIASTAIETFVLGASSRHGFMRISQMNVMKGAPDFCTIYVISKSKISSVRKASRPAPIESNLGGRKHGLQDQLRIGRSSQSPCLQNEQFNSFTVRFPFPSSTAQLSPPIGPTNRIATPRRGGITLSSYAL